MMRNRVIILFQHLVNLGTKQKKYRNTSSENLTIAINDNWISNPVTINLSEDGFQVRSGVEIPRTVIFNDDKSSCSVT
jgi:hypothetical protein